MPPGELAVVFVLVDGRLKGAMASADIVQPEAKQAMAAAAALSVGSVIVAVDARPLRLEK